MKLRKAILIGPAAILLLQTKSFCQSNQTTASIPTETNSTAYVSQTSREEILTNIEVGSITNIGWSGWVVIFTTKTQSYYVADGQRDHQTVGWPQKVLDFQTKMISAFDQCKFLASTNRSSGFVVHAIHRDPPKNKERLMADMVFYNDCNNRQSASGQLPIISGAFATDKSFLDKTKGGQAFKNPTAYKIAKSFDLNVPITFEDESESNFIAHVHQASWEQTLTNVEVGSITNHGHVGMLITIKTKTQSYHVAKWAHAQRWADWPKEVLDDQTHMIINFEKCESLASTNRNSGFVFHTVHHRLPNSNERLMSDAVFYADYSKRQTTNGQLPIISGVFFSDISMLELPDYGFPDGYGFWGASAYTKSKSIDLNVPLIFEDEFKVVEPNAPSANLHPTPPGFASRLDYLRSLTNEVIISTAYKEGLISDDEAMEATSIRGSSLPYTNMVDVHKAYDQGLIGKGEAMMLDEKIESAKENVKPQNLYGKVVDQNGQPVAGVDVTGYIELKGWDGKTEPHKTQTDTEGLFQFTSLKGASLSADVSKPGYEYDYRVGRIAPTGKESSPNDQATFIMWKMKKPEPMIHRQKFYGITPDWRIFTIDLEKHQKIEGTNTMGDFMIQIQRPAHIEPQERFDWSFVMTAIGGGFIEVTNNGYLYEAPESGYLPQYKFNMSASEENENWRQYAYSRYVGVKKTFYIKSRNGQVYGHFSINISPYYNDTSALDIEYYINPAGSRNLEWDGKIQVYKSGDKFLPVLRSSPNPK